MKLAFVLAAFFLIIFRLYYKTLWPWVWDKHQVTITVKTDGSYERIHYRGSIRLTGDETGIDSISPGGLIQYEHNDLSVKVKSNSHGALIYDVRDDGTRLEAEGSGRKAITEALREMINYGFDGRDRMKRVYDRGGDSALVREIPLLKSPGLADMYRKYIASHQAVPDDSLLQNKQ